MIYCNPTHIDEIAGGRLERHRKPAGLDMNDYGMFRSEREVACAVGVRSELAFTEFLSLLKKELHDALSAADVPQQVLIDLIMHPEADLTMENYAALGRTIREIFGDEIFVFRAGFSISDGLPDNHKDIMVFIA